MDAQWQKSRGIEERIIVKGILYLDTPTHLGNGDADGPLDMPLLLDPLDRSALLTGSSIAGALRNYVRQYNPQAAELLFGQVQPRTSIESPLIVDDARSTQPELELRDGVTIDPITRTAEQHKKFDIELLAAGTSFELCFELLVLKRDANQLRQAFALALEGLEKGEIRLGKRKRRGFGRCHVKKWTVSRYDMTTPKGMLAWLQNDLSVRRQGSDIAKLLRVTPNRSNKDPWCTLKGTFGIDGSLLIRSTSAHPDDPDMVHLRSKRLLQDGQKQVPVLSGTSLAGALRGQALQIANTLGKDGRKVTNELFGYRHYDEKDKTPPTASRIWVDEAVIKDPLELVQTRLKVDRFTSGPYPGALFSQQPVFCTPETSVEINLRISTPTDAEVGLLLLLLKDLWTGELPIGGESSVGRGRLSGQEATLTYKKQTWHFVRKDQDQLVVEGDQKQLEQFIDALVTEGEHDDAK